MNGDDVGVPGNGVDLQHAEGLGDVDGKNQPSIRAEASKFDHVVPESVLKFNVTDGNQSCLARDRRLDVVKLGACLTFWNENRSHANPAQIHPRIDQTGKLLLRDDDFVTWVPGQAVRDDAEGLGKI